MSFLRVMDFDFPVIGFYIALLPIMKAPTEEKE
jgi:hypothetical protein